MTLRPLAFDLTVYAVVMLTVAACTLGLPAGEAEFKITSFETTRRLTWMNASTNGVCTVESAPIPSGPWTPGLNVFTSNLVGHITLSLPASNTFYRLLSVDVSPTPAGFTNFINSYGIIETIAGNGLGGTDGTNYWESNYEGGFATNAALSRPHFAMADDAGNVFIVDKNSHSVLKVTKDGRIHTVLGTHMAGQGFDGTTNGTNYTLNYPNGLWVRRDGTVYVLDTGNGDVVRLDTNGIVSELFSAVLETNNSAAITDDLKGGRGLWVKDDESVAFFCTGTKLQQWKGGVVTTLSDKFNDLGNIAVTPKGDVIATDLGANKVYLVDATGGQTGSRTTIAGSGAGGSGGAVDGAPALNAKLSEVRGVWPVPNGGYLLATHKGSQVLYMDAAGIIHVLVDGLISPNHAGDGQWFYAPGQKVAEVRSVTMTSKGDILICENDYGYIRRIRFNRLQP